MILERCTFIIIYLALSGLNPSSSQAALNFSDTPATRDKITRERHPISDPQLSASYSSRTVAQTTTEQSIETERTFQLTDKSSLQENPAIADRDAVDLGSIETLPLSWAFGAMALTSAISLFLLWLLFRKPPSEDLSDVMTIADRQTTSTETVSEPELLTQTTSDNNPSRDEAIAFPAFDLETDNPITAKKLSKSSPLNLTAERIDVVRELIRDLQPDGSAETSIDTLNSVRADRRRKAIWELTKIGDYRSIEPLLEIMTQVGEPDKSLIIEAVNQISSRSFQSINERLFINLEDRDPGVRLSAIRDLKNLYQFVAPAITKMAQMQSDVDYEVRQTAIQALVQLNANPLPTFSDTIKNSKNSAKPEIEKLVSGEDSEANLHLVAYLLAELDAEK